MNLPILWSVGAALLGAAPASFQVTASPNDPAFRCGAHLAPALTFRAPPPGTKSLAVVVWDQQPKKLSGRWVVWDLPPGIPGLPGETGKVGTNDAGQLGYSAPCGQVRHDVYVDLYALNVASLNLAAGAPLRAVHDAIHRHSLQEARAHFVLGQRSAQR